MTMNKIIIALLSTHWVRITASDIYTHSYRQWWLHWNWLLMAGLLHQRELCLYSESTGSLQNLVWP